MTKQALFTNAGILFDAVAVGCVTLMFLAGNDVWHDTGRPAIWTLQGPPYADLRVFVVGYYVLALLVLARVATRISCAILARRSG